MSNRWPFHIKPRPGPLNVPHPRSVLVYILLAIALIFLGGTAAGAWK